MARAWPWVLLATVLASGALAGQVPPPVPQAPGQLVEAVVGPLATFDPIQATSAGERTVADNVFQTLVTVRGGRLQPRLAASWRMQGSALVFQLDPRARWSNGQPVTAGQVAQALNAVGAPLPGVSSGPPRWTASGSGTLVLHGVASALQVLGTLATLPWAVVLPSDRTAGGGHWQLAALIGSGGWRLDQWDWDWRASFRPTAGDVTWSVTVERFPTLALAEASVVNGVADVLPLPVGALGTLPKRWLKWVHWVPDGRTLWWTSLGGPSPRRVSTTRLAALAFRGRGPHVAARTLAVPATGVVAVDRGDAIATALGDALVRLQPGLRVERVSGSGPFPGVEAYLGPYPVSVGGSPPTPVAPDGSWWMWSTAVRRLTVFPDNSLDWKSVQWQR
ncbi:MAG: hypothetical protein K6U14_02800 [Firmicutes bacterium]|nr:hypothetical protein [Alicyclobacillaceae bacterium]MCL6496549.1 hypothetical protein [Bacillota bacterium]